MQSGLNMAANDCFWPILLKNSVIQNCLIIDRRKRLFYTLLFKIRFWTPQPKVKDFNVGRVLFSCGNHGRQFQQNRPIAVARLIRQVGLRWHFCMHGRAYDRGVPRKLFMCRRQLRAIHHTESSESLSLQPVSQRSWGGICFLRQCSA